MIDLHTHSTASDGTDAPGELVAAAKAAGVGTLAITDHDSTQGWDAAAEAATACGVDLVRGIEVSCRHGGVSIHLLAYLPDPESPTLVAELAHARASREARLARMVALMEADGVPITYAEVLAQVQRPGTTVGRPHIADALVASGVVPHRDEAFASYLHSGTPYYVAHYACEVVAAVRFVREAGGVAVMAHPFAAARGRVVGDDVIEAMADAGLAGLEAFHHDHDAEQTRHAVDLARSLGLFVTGSSDYHGTGKVNVLGEHVTDPDVLAAIEEQARSGVAVLRS